MILSPLLFITARIRRMGKVMFSQVSVHSHPRLPQSQVLFQVSGHRSQDLRYPMSRTGLGTPPPSQDRTAVPPSQDRTGVPPSARTGLGYPAVQDRTGVRPPPGQDRTGVPYPPARTAERVLTTDFRPINSLGFGARRIRLKLLPRLLREYFNILRGIMTQNGFDC